MFYVYILETLNQVPDRYGFNRFYAGQTNNIHRRLKEHAAGDGAEVTKLCGIDQLVFVREVDSREVALALESNLTRRINEGWVPPESSCCFISVDQAIKTYSGWWYS